MLGQAQKPLHGVASWVNVALDLGLLAVASVMTASSKGALTPLGLVTFAAAAALWLLASRALHQYGPWNAQGPLSDLLVTALLVLGVAAVLAVFGALRMGAFLEILLPTVLTVRLVLRATWELRNRSQAQVLVVGAGPLGRHTGLDLRAAWPRRRLVGYLALPGDADESRLPAPLLGAADDIEAALSVRAVDEVYVAGHVERHVEAMRAVVRVCERFGVPFALPASYLRFDRARPAPAIPDGYLHFVTAEPKRVQLALKRLLDIVASAAALALLFPLLVGVAAAILLTSRGPVFFRQVRVGQHGRPFRMLKLRSMVANAEELKRGIAAQNEQSGPVFKIKDDPRVTAVGRFIRRHSIDELPQLVNVLRGEMTLVGPRPPLPEEVAKYEPWQRRRLSVRPGLTCHWQVSGRGEIAFAEWMYLDMQYIDHWSLAGDLRLILKTLPVVLSGRGAS